MPNAIKYKEGNLTGSLQKGNVALGISVQGPTSTTGWYSGLTPDLNRYVVYKTDASNTPRIFYPADDSELIRLAKQEGATGVNTGSAISVLSWMATQTNLMVVNKNYPDIVTDELSLLVDASFTPSYPTTASTWYDLSGNSNNGSLINGTAWSSSGWFDFDGADDYVQLGTALSASGEFTMTCFFKKDTNSERSFLGKVVGGGAGTKIIFLSNNNYFIRIDDGGTQNNFNIGYTTSMNGAWHYLAATRNSSGVVQASLNGKDLIGSEIRGGTFAPTAIGRNADGQYWDGSLKDMKFYNRFLSQQEILQNYYQAPIVTNGLVFAVDASNLVSYESGSTTTYSMTGSISGSLINGTNFISDYGGGWNLDGTDDYITFGNQTLISDDFTIEVWVNIEDIPSKEHFLINIGYSSSSSLLIVLNSSGNGTFSFQPYYRTATGVVTGYSAGSGYTGVVNQVVLTRSGNTNTGYINGVPTGVTFSESGGATTLASNLNLQLGWAIPRNKSTAYLQGDIYASKIYNKTLTAEEVAQNFNAQRNRFGF
jgi:hypothetical protein